MPLLASRSRLTSKGLFPNSVVGRDRQVPDRVEQGGVRGVDVPSGPRLGEHCVTFWSGIGA